jgi:capsular exopolysaccharide synthesis family protein
MRVSIDDILSSYKVTSPNPREQTYYFSVLLKGTDYPLVTQTANTIADMFVESNLSLKRCRIKESLTIIGKQLNAAKNQLSKSKDELKLFLSENPAVGLSQSTQMVMNQLIQLETESIENSDRVEQTNELKKKLSISSQQETERILSEVIAFLQSNGNLSSVSLQLSFNQQQEQKRNAIGNYDRDHPIFKEMDKKLSDLKPQAIQALDSYINQLNKLRSEKNQSIARISSQLKSTPSKELQLAELQKRQEINSEIYSSLLVKFNEISVAESVQKSDVFVMDYAVQPIPPPFIEQKINAFLFIIVLISLLTLGPAIIFDLFDKTVRTEQELRKLVPYNFLVTLPKINVLKQATQQYNLGNIKSSKNEKPMDEILVNHPKNIYPSYTIELFRSLITKIHLNLSNEIDKSIAVFSLNTKEGKSTVAANLALSIAEHDIKTLLIDCDMRRGISHNFFNLPNSPGLSDYLSDSLNNNQALPSSIPMQQTCIRNLWLISSGPPVDNPQKYLNSAAMVALKLRLLQQPFFIVFDTPPIGVASEVAILNNLVSRFLLVLKAGYTNTFDLCKIIQKDFPVIEKKIIGVVLNMGETVRHSKFYKYY